MFIFYEDVISNEAKNLRKNVEKIINENFNISKSYKIKLKKGYMIIKTIITLKGFKNKEISNLTNTFDPIIASQNKNFYNNFHNKIQDCNSKGKILNKIFNKKNENCRIFTLKENTFFLPEESNNKANNFNVMSSSRKTLLNKHSRKKSKYIKSDFQDFLQNEYFIKVHCKSLQIIKTIEFSCFSKTIKNSSTSKNKKFIHYGERKFIFPGKIMSVSCYEIFLIDSPKLLLTQKTKTLQIKISVIIIIYIILSFYMMLILQDLFIKYGDNLFEVCISPFLITWLINNIFAFNLMILITSLILYYYGELILNKKKPPIYISAITNIFVTPIIFNHYSALKLYQHFK